MPGGLRNNSLVLFQESYMEFLDLEGEEGDDYFDGEDFWDEDDLSFGEGSRKRKRGKIRSSGGGYPLSTLPPGVALRMPF